MAAEQWWVLDMDEGVISGPHATKKAALQDVGVQHYPYYKSTRFAPGGYEIFFGFDKDDREQYYVSTTTQALKDGFDWALERSKLKEDCPDE